MKIKKKMLKTVTKDSCLFSALKSKYTKVLKLKRSNQFNSYTKEFYWGSESNEASVWGWTGKDFVRIKGETILMPKEVTENGIDDCDEYYKEIIDYDTLKESGYNYFVVLSSFEVQAAVGYGGDTNTIYYLD